MKRLALLFSLLAFSAQAQPLTPAQILTDINTRLIDNSSGLITPQVLRQVLGEMVGGYCDLKGTQCTITGPVTINPLANSSVLGLVVNQTGSLTDSNGGNITGISGQGFAYNYIDIESDARADFGPSSYTMGQFTVLKTGGSNARGSKIAQKAWVYRYAPDNTAQAYGDTIGIAGLASSNSGDGGAGAAFTGSISGTTLTVTAGTVSGGAIAVGQTVVGVGVTAGTTISSGSGLSWTVNNSQTVTSRRLATSSTAGHRGTLFGSSFVAQAADPSPDLFVVSGSEVDIGITAGASAYYRLGWSVVDNGAVQGTNQDMAFEIGAAGGPGFRCGYCFTSLHGSQGISTNGTLIGTDGIAATVFRGIDFSAYTISQWFILGPAGSNFSVDGGGNLAANTVFANTIEATNPQGGIGYATGAGSAVTQTTSRSTGVTINNLTGAITLVSAAGSTTPTTFTVTNTGAIHATDVVIVNQKSGTDKYEIFVTAVAANSFNITFFTTGGTTTEQPVFNYAIIRGAAS